MLGIYLKLFGVSLDFLESSASLQKIPPNPLLEALSLGIILVFITTLVFVIRDLDIGIPRILIFLRNMIKMWI